MDKTLNGLCQKQITNLLPVQDIGGNSREYSKNSTKLNSMKFQEGWKKRLKLRRKKRGFREWRGGVHDKNFEKIFSWIYINIKCFQKTTFFYGLDIYKYIKAHLKKIHFETIFITSCIGKIHNKVDTSLIFLENITS